MEITEILLSPNKYSRPCTPLKRIKKIAVHYVGNPGTSALANRNYFNSLANTHSTYASSHYIIGLDGEILRCVPENEVAYCTGKANNCSISIENCHLKEDGKFNEKTLKSLIELCAMLCKKYRLDPITDIIRHYDVSGKICPRWWVLHPDEFIEFKKAVKEKMDKGEINMDEVARLDNRINKLEKMLADNKEKVFNKVNDVPDWGMATVKKLLEKGILKGDGEELTLTYTLLRLLVINDRAGLYD